MALPAASYPPPPVANPIAVVGSQLLAPYPVDLIMVKKLMTLAEGTFTVTDIKGSIMLKAKGSIFSIHDRRTQLDASNNPIILLQQKIMSMHRRWQVYGGVSSDSKDLLFPAKKPSLIQFKTELDVFLRCQHKRRCA
ncbi:LURP1-related protein domain containing protein [Trema orientale]|uniref:LURP1-related protein domain containing protein n=1 Tax=Trema orientale TaxID=63057 RepID=A0A2P5F9A9_TREOI|nr:LURP1-related protein domain containing protein [Trema orientale]